MKRTFSTDADKIIEMIERIKRNQKKLAEIIIREGWIYESDYTHKELDDFKNSLIISTISFEYEEDGLSCLLSVSAEKFLEDNLSISIHTDNSIEIEGWTI